MAAASRRTKFIAFLRAINVGGHFFKMEQLRALFSELGFSGVETFINSGNVIFEARSADAGALERKIERHLAAALDYAVAVFLRTPAELSDIVSRKPFDSAATDAASSFCVGFLARPLGNDERERLLKLKTDNDEFRVDHREIYWLSRVGQGESKFNNGVCERAIRTKTTFRSMTTVAKLAAKYPPG